MFLRQHVLKLVFVLTFTINILNQYQDKVNFKYILNLSSDINIDITQTIKDLKRYQKNFKIIITSR